MDAALDKLLLTVAMQQFYAFILAAIRIAGLMTIGPIFGQSLVPANVRILLILSIAFVLTPVLHTQSHNGFVRLDADGNGLITRDEVPETLVPRYERLLQTTGKQPDAGVTRSEFTQGSLSVKMPGTVLDFAWIIAGEFALGLVLGLGVLIVLSGLQLAGELIDQQTGLSLGGVANPMFDVEGSITGQFLFLFGVTLVLLIEPISGHLQIVAALVETFQTLPVGEAYVTGGTVDLLRDLVHQSLVLGVQAAAPVLAVMSLVAVTMGFLGRSVPPINVLVVGFPIRVLVSLIVLSASLSGIARNVVDTVPRAIDQLRHSLSGL